LSRRCYNRRQEALRCGSAMGRLPSLHSFTGNPDGALPKGAVVFGGDGALYVTTYGGGTFESGARYKLARTTGEGRQPFYTASVRRRPPRITPLSSPTGLWTEIVQHTFTGQNGDGATPVAAQYFPLYELRHTFTTRLSAGGIATISWRKCCDRAMPGCSSDTARRG
jgi:hypothetical protein